MTVKDLIEHLGDFMPDLDMHELPDHSQEWFDFLQAEVNYEIVRRSGNKSHLSGI